MTIDLKKPILGLAFALAGAGAASADPVTLKVHHFLPSGSGAHNNIIVPWCEKIEKESEAS